MTISNVSFMCLCSNWEFRMARRYSSEGIAHNCAHLKLSDAARLVLFHSKEKELTQSWMFFLISLAFQRKIGGWVNLGYLRILPVLWRGPMGLFLSRPGEVVMHSLSAIPSYWWHWFGDPPTVPQNWGPGGHFRFQPFSGIRQTKKSSLKLGKARGKTFWRINQVSLQKRP